MVLLCLRRYLTFFNGIWSSVMLYREYPEKSFKSFSLLANALPVGIPAEGLGSGILQLGVECFSRKISFRKTNSPRIGRIPIRLKDSNLRLKNSQAQSFSRNTDGQGICEQAEAFEGFFRVFSIEHDSDQIVIAK